MENLTQAQKNILNSLASEFANINEKYKSTNGNIFAHLVEEVKSENKRIEEIKILNKIGREKMNNQITQDFNKYWDTFQDLGIKMAISYPNVREDVFELVTINGHKKISDHKNRNILKWEYDELNDYENILGAPRSWIYDFRIEWNQKLFTKIEELFQDDDFQYYLKELINQA